MDEFEEKILKTFVNIGLGTVGVVVGTFGAIVIKNILNLGIEEDWFDGVLVAGMGSIGICYLTQGKFSNRIMDILR